MFSWENPDDRVAIVQMNSELRHARLELLSAECATHQLRLRFSTENLARYGEQDLLRKAIGSAAALNDFYAAIERQIPRGEQSAHPDWPKLSQEQALEFSAAISAYMREQRDHYFPSGMPLSLEIKAKMQPYFSPALLGRVHLVELNGAPMPEPPFFSQARDLGFDMPDFLRMPSLTFMDVIVFTESINDGALFHGLAHAVQLQILGLQRYCDLLLRGFLRTNAFFVVPLEAHAFALESKFLRNGLEPFSVEDQVRLWIREGRY